MAIGIYPMLSCDHVKKEVKGRSESLLCTHLLLYHRREPAYPNTEQPTKGVPTIHCYQIIPWCTAWQWLTSGSAKHIFHSYNYLDFHDRVLVWGDVENLGWINVTRKHRSFRCIVNVNQELHERQTHRHHEWMAESGSKMMSLAG